MNDYDSFLSRKMAVAPSVGIQDVGDLPQAIKPFQKDLVRWALRRGRAAIFANTGLGKTLMQLSWANAIRRHSGGRILILTPLAVAQQTIEEATKFGIGGVAYARDETAIQTDIAITNYDRIEKFDLTKFSGIVLDESSILKAHDSKTRMVLTQICQNIPYRLACTATPAPNDWVELGNHAEFLGVSTQKEMLSTYFVHDGSIRAGAEGGQDGWRLKRHAQDRFWQWVASWGAMVRHPRDLGYADAGYDLPPLNYHQITVSVDYKPQAGMLFPMEARTMSERLAARRNSIADRVKAAVDIVATEPSKPWLIWCNLNAESDAMRSALPNAVDVRGSDDPDLKAERLLGFAHGEIGILISKPSIAGFGMNFQCCSNMIFLGLNDSFEQVFQAVRRCWRFGQNQPVNVYMIASELEGAVVSNLSRKEVAYEAMGAAMAEHMQDFVRSEVLGSNTMRMRQFNQEMKMPEWLS